MHVTALLGRSATMIYFGQEVGEAAPVAAGFGPAYDTTIFDYWGVEAHQRWMNDGLFDGGALTEEEADLRESYRNLLRFAATAPALAGTTEVLPISEGDESLFAFVRRSEEQSLLVVTNFSSSESGSAVLAGAVSGSSEPLSVLFGQPGKLERDESGSLSVSLPPLETLVLEIN